MPLSTSHSRPRPGLVPLAPTKAIRFGWGLLLVLLLVSVPGCSGCRNQSQAGKDAPQDEEDKEKPKPDFEVDRMYIQPSDSALSRNAVKPGHYIAATQQMKANNFDFRASLDTASVDRDGRPLPVDDTQFTMAMSRVAILPKGQVKSFETTYFVPRRTEGNSKQVWLKSLLNRSGREVSGTMQPTTRMPDYQYYLVALASDPDSYGYLKRLDSVAPPHDDLDAAEPVLYYRVVLPKVGRDPPVPSNGLVWTSIAVILWDEVDPNLLDRQQQLAMLDWLHWGGQLIVSGPDSLDLLRGSFLEPYMPASSGRSVELRQADFAELNAYWSLRVARRNETLTLDVLDEKPVVGVELQPAPDGRVMPHTGGLVVERQVGVGRIVVTAFPLSAQNIVNWRSFDSFFNACLLRRPARRFEVKDEILQLAWADSQRYAEKDAALITTQRYFSRDISDLVAAPLPAGSPAGGNDVPKGPPVPQPTQASAAEPPQIETADEEQDDTQADAQVVEQNGKPDAQPVAGQPAAPAAEQLEPRESDQRELEYRGRGYRSWAESGLAGWNDYSGVANAVREALKDAAGISIPKSGFVFRVLAVYLVVLVPVNWCVFRLLGRVEWAWVAAPLIAVVGAVAVVRLAQLDIGFARSRTEIATLEIHGDYPRAHLTRYAALYSSLSTSYELEFEESTALAQPFPAQRGRHSSLRPIQFFQQDGKTRLSGFQVDSNSTGMVHCEQMFPLGGTLQLVEAAGDQWQVRNSTALRLRDVGVLRRTPRGLEAAWIGELNPQALVPLQFRPTSTSWFPEWDQANTTLSHERHVSLLLQERDRNQDRRLDLAEFETVEQGSSQTFSGLDQNLDSRLDELELIDWSRRARAGEISIGRLLDLAARQLVLAEGDVRLIGWSDQELPGLNCRPKASQSLARLMVLAHLRHAPLPDPQRDANCRADVTDEDEAEKNTEAAENAAEDTPERPDGS